MVLFTNTEVLIPNILIDMIEAGKGNQLTFDKLEECREEIVKILSKDFNISAVIQWGDYPEVYVAKYSDLFSITDDVISTRTNDTEVLRKKFRGPLSYELLSAIIKGTNIVFN